MYRVLYTLLYAVIFSLTLSGCVDSGIDDGYNDDDDKSGDEEVSDVITWIDEELDYYYLYNEEYSTADLDMTLDFESFVDDNLMALTTNVLDGKYVDGVRQYVYSYVESTSSSLVSSTRSITSTEVGYGVIAVAIYNDQFSNPIYYGVRGVYPGSPADLAGIKRGDYITAVNGSSINTTNDYATIFYPSLGDEVTLTINYRSSVTLTSTQVELNPILKCEFLDSDKKIGYLVYCKFNAEYDDELTAALASLSEAEDLILDLRLNGGGYNSSAVLLASAIAGSSAVGKVFARYYYNDNLESRYSNSSKYDYFAKSSVEFKNLSQKIYVLTSNSTASASELTINALRGIDFEVDIIGKTTEGKNVGAFLLQKTIDNVDYELAPISFKSANAVGFYSYENGFDPDYIVDEYSNFADFGVGDPLVDKALALINSTQLSTTRSTSTTEQESAIVVGESMGRESYNIMINDIKE